MKSQAYIEGEEEATQWIIYDYYYGKDYPEPDQYQKGTMEYSDWMKGFHDHLKFFQEENRIRQEQESILSEALDNFWRLTGPQSDISKSD